MNKSKSVEVLKDVLFFTVFQVLVVGVVGVDQPGEVHRSKERQRVIGSGLRACLATPPQQHPRRYDAHQGPPTHTLHDRSSRGLRAALVIGPGLYQTARGVAAGGHCHAMSRRDSSRNQCRYDAVGRLLSWLS